MSQWTPFYEGDYIRDTRHLSQGEHGAYILLLTYYWSTGRALPLDKKEIYRITSAFSEKEKVNTNRILAQFFDEKSDGYHNKKCDEIILKKIEKSRTLSENGKKGARAKILANASSLPKQMVKQKASILQPEPQLEENTPLSPPEGGKPKRAFRLPDDWEPDQKLLTWALENHPTVDTRQQTILFKNHFIGNGKRMLEWGRTWQNWIARSLEFGRPNPKPEATPKQPSRSETMLEAWQSGKSFRLKDSGKVVPASSIEPFNHLSQRVTEDNPTAFKGKASGNVAFFTEWEIVP